MKRAAFQFFGFFLSALLPSVIVWAITRPPKEPTKPPPPDDAGVPVRTP